MNLKEDRGFPVCSDPKHHDPSELPTPVQSQEHTGEDQMLTVPPDPSLACCWSVTSDPTLLWFRNRTFNDGDGEHCGTAHCKSDSVQCRNGMTGEPI